MAKLGTRKGNATHTHMVLGSLGAHCWFWGWSLSTLLQVYLPNGVGGKLQKCSGEPGWQCLWGKVRRTLKDWSEIKRTYNSSRAGVPTIWLCYIMSMSLAHVKNLEEFCFFQHSCFSSAFNTNTVIFHFPNNQSKLTGLFSEKWVTFNTMTDISGQSINNCASIFSKKIIINNYCL